MTNNRPRIILTKSKKHPKILEYSKFLIKKFTFILFLNVNYYFQLNVNLIL
jgi:hypothetical protein